MKKYPLISILLVVLFVPLWPQGSQSGADPASYIGLTLTDLIGSHGAPRSVYPIRGIAEWQDDVVFAYDDVDFYIYKDRIWQLGVKSAYMIQAGDSKSVVSLKFGEALSSGDNYAIFSLRGQNWPAALRCNFDAEGKVTEIFIFRSDM